MTLPGKISAICLLGLSTFAFGSGIPKTLLPDNVVLCGSDTGCINKTLFGRTYKVLTTPRFTVMVAVSHEGSYTRADVSITNNEGYSLNLSPDDFRIEVEGRSKALSYVEPTNLKGIAPPPSIPTAETFVMPSEASVSGKHKKGHKAVTSAESASTQASVPVAEELPVSEGTASRTGSAHLQTVAAVSGPEPSAEVLPMDAEAKRSAALQEAIDAATAQKDLSAGIVSPNEIVRGRVFFERDKHAKELTVVLPLAGIVFEFPYDMEHEGH